MSRSSFASGQAAVATLALVLGFAFFDSRGAAAQPRPGDVFREFVYTVRGGHFGEVDPDSPRMTDTSWSMYGRPTRLVRPLEIDLEGATRAELSIEYWGGHGGTTGQRFSVNGNGWIDIPQPEGTPTKPNCYYRTLLGNNAVPIPLDHLEDGVNEFRFTAGPQACPSGNWGFYWVYSFTVRLYYDPSTPHPDGRIVSPQPGDTLGELPLLEAEITPASAPIRQVDFIGYYRDFNWDGDGVFEKWHYVTEQGLIERHIGTASGAPYRVRWYKDWLPDQEEPVQLALKITDETGLSYMTPALQGVVSEHPNWSIKMYTSEDVPEIFGVRVERTRMCTINIPDELTNARVARLIVSTWSAKTNDGSTHEIRINGHRLADNFGRFHDYSTDELNVPIEWLKEGANEITTYSTFTGHALEVNWPGPVLKVAYVTGTGSH